MECLPFLEFATKTPGTLGAGRDNFDLDISQLSRSSPGSQQTSGLKRDEQTRLLRE